MTQRPFRRESLPEGSVAHPRDVIIDEAHNRAYVSAALTGFIEVYDTKTLEHIGQLEFVVERGKNLFNSTDLALDSAGGNSMASAAIRHG
jgi:DNA-binding beta-propeller fold protein YncE